MEVTKVAGVDNGDELAAFDPESWLKVCTCGDKSSFCLSAFTSLYLLNFILKSRFFSPSLDAY